MPGDPPPRMMALNVYLNNGNTKAGEVKKKKKKKKNRKLQVPAKTKYKQGYHHFH